MMDKFAAMRIATSDLQRVRSSSASALAAFKLITDSNLIGGVNGGRQRGQGRRPAPARSDQHFDGKRLSRRFPAIRSARVHEAFDGKRIFEGELGHTTLDDILVLIS